VLTVPYFAGRYENSTALTAEQIKKKLIAARVKNAQRVNVPDFLAKSGAFADSTGEAGRAKVWKLTDTGSRRSSRSLRHGNEHQFWFDAGNQFKVSITMQKRHARKNSVRRYQAVIRGSRSYACPSTSRVQMRGAARCFPSVWRVYHWQLAEDPIPSSESVRAIRAL
jgi:hypothetical protein